MTDHMDLLLPKMASMRLKNQQVTLIIAAKGGKVILHPLMLAAASPTFRATHKQVKNLINMLRKHLSLLFNFNLFFIL